MIVMRSQEILTGDYLRTKPCQDFDQVIIVIIVVVVAAAAAAAAAVSFIIVSPTRAETSTRYVRACVRALPACQHACLPCLPCVQGVPVYMYACLRVYMRACVLASISTGPHERSRACVHVCRRMYLCAYAHACARACALMCAHTCA